MVELVPQALGEVGQARAAVVGPVVDLAVGVGAHLDRRVEQVGDAGLLVTDHRPAVREAVEVVEGAGRPKGVAGDEDLSRENLDPELPQLGVVRLDVSPHPLRSVLEPLGLAVGEGVDCRAPVRLGRRLGGLERHLDVLVELGLGDLVVLLVAGLEVRQRRDHRGDVLATSDAHHGQPPLPHLEAGLHAGGVVGQARCPAVPLALAAEGGDEQGAPPAVPLRPCLDVVLESHQSSSPFVSAFVRCSRA